MDMMELIRTRKSVRSFDGRTLSEEDRAKIVSYIDAIENPYDIPVRFIVLDAKENELSSPVIQGEQFYIAGKVPKTEHCEEAFGFSFEKMVLYARSLGVGTTIVGGTMKREKFERAAKTGSDEYMLCVSPLGYPAKKHSIRESAMRTAIRADKRKPNKELFFDGSFLKPLSVSEDKEISSALEAVRLAPSAVNKQPWRVVRDGELYHFYEKHSLKAGEWDMQKIDMGIALCHMMSVTGGELLITDPGIQTADDTEYIATVRV